MSRAPFTVALTERSWMPRFWATEATLLAKALRPPPDKRIGLTDIETRYRKRYVDLAANPELVRRLARGEGCHVFDVEGRKWLDMYGGHAVALAWSMKAIYDIDEDDVWWAASDVGWVVGHSYIVYAPLFKGCTTVFF